MGTPLLVRIRDRVVNLSNTTEINLAASEYNPANRDPKTGKGGDKESCVVIYYAVSNGEGPDSSIVFGEDAQTLRSFFSGIAYTVKLSEGTV